MLNSEARIFCITANITLLYFHVKFQSLTEPLLLREGFRVEAICVSLSSGKDSFITTLM